MSQDPERILSGNGGRSAEREILRAGLDVDPPPGAKEEIWASLGGRLPPSDGGGSGGIDVIRTTIWKNVAIGFAMGLLGIGAAQLAWHYSKPTPAAATVAIEAPPAANPAVREPSPPEPAAELHADVPPKRPMERRASPSPRDPEPEPEPELEIGSSIASLPPAASADPVEKRKSQLKDESRMLREARAALQSRNPARALAILNEARKQYPALILSQEHEALVIDALLASGGKSDAESRARRFLLNYPQSPHAEKMRAIANSP
jgi:hypothetical protein